LAIPLWGHVRQAQCLQLGYYCMQLSAMRNTPEQALGSRVSNDADTRPCRRWNALSLPGDAQGTPSWQMLVADLREILRLKQPEVIVLPHPRLDPHPDHQATTQALREALAAADYHPEHFLCYANHLHNTDLWPMGPAGNGVTLPPQFDPDMGCWPWLLPMSADQQIDKAMALAMQHDLQSPLSWKKHARRRIQSLLAGRNWPRSGENEYFRKAVRAGELFFVSSNLNELER
jgi:LmbE family N-acetylglucosaminyl deacetylase